MYRAQYRNFGSSENIVVCHTVDVNSTNWAGIRWYELEKSGSSWAVRQQGTYAPDSDNRWMGSISMNGNHEIGIAYSVSSNTTYPSIRYTGQSSPENNAASGVLDYPEVSILEGTNSQTAANRWGDYSLLSVDPERTFYYFHFMRILDIITAVNKIRNVDIEIFRIIIYTYIQHNISINIIDI